MSENKNNQHLNEDELWEKKFAEDPAETPPTSRTERRAREEEHQGGSSNWLAVAVLVLAALFIIPTLWFAWSSNQDAKEFEAEQEKIEVTEKSEEEKKKEAEERKKKEAEAKKDKEKEEAEKEKAEQEKQEEKEKAEREREQEAAAERQRQEAERQRQAAEREAQNQIRQSQANQSSTAEQNYSGNTYTVQPKDNLYRIALNHGMTLDELMQLNGLSSTTIQAGQVLKVK